MFKNMSESFLRLSCGKNDTKMRRMSIVKSRFTKPPFWQTQKTRTMYPENMTKENITFISEHIEKSYASPLKRAPPFEKTPVSEAAGGGGQWVPFSYRCGLIATKLGVYPMWQKDGTKIDASLVQVSDNHVIKYIPPDELRRTDAKYERRVQNADKQIGAVVVGADSADPRLFTKEYFKLFEEAGVTPARRLSKFYVTPNARLPPGLRLSAAHFQPGDRVDCSGITTDHGFQGVMKRWNFHGMPPDSHGVQKSHRRPGCIGGGGGKRVGVWRGKKMPGHMGRQMRTLRASEVLRVDSKMDLIWLRGIGIPGEPGSYVILRDSIITKYRRTERNRAFFPTYAPSEEGEGQTVVCADKLHTFDLPSIAYPDEENK